MSEIKRRKKEEDWQDAPEERPEYEKTYRDGSAVNECWADREEMIGYRKTPRNESKY